MRPVTVGNPPNYPYHTPISLNGNVPPFTPPSAMNTVYNQALAFTRTVRWVQDELLDKAVRGHAFPNGLATADEERQAKDMMGSRLYDEYREARLDLTAMIGAFCSFCELPIPGHLLAIEHIAPKGRYPDTYVWWWNFLRACRDCKSIKAQKPPRATARGWTGVAHPTENQTWQQIIGHYYWPDNDADTYRIFDRSYWFDTETLAPQQQNIPDFASRLNVEVSAVGTDIRANILNGGVMQNNTQVQVHIFNNNGGARGTLTLNHTGLNRHDSAREAARTREWLYCLLQLRELLATIGPMPNPYRQNTFDGMFRMMLSSAARSGFYSVWVEILTARAFPANIATGGFANLGAKFVFDTQTANQPVPARRFPGTNVAQVP
jgi:hypothetical protein